MINYECSKYKTCRNNFKSMDLFRISKDGRKTILCSKYETKKLIKKGKNQSYKPNNSICYVSLVQAIEQKLCMDLHL